ncbi:ABC-three component system protein [Aneurinibacillus sp. UBA3580]|uniref:ABC-three component system protein n=1 Tax=Aneurinibacillus sp. UBA3580 TaxID=1946041 RepID=UPI00257F98B4|nr:ABC-three component system protein [Aneurinibacillus sp. UBA3580]
MTDFSAIPSMLGYLYQIRYALFLLLRAELEYCLSIEWLDDISLQENGEIKELIQTKHVSSDSIPNTSKDFWKTIRVWSEAILNNELNLNESLFTLITTATAREEDSLARFLYPKKTELRNEEEALKAMTLIAIEGINKEHKSNKKAYEAFLKLDEKQKRFLVKRINVIDGSSNILDTKEEIKKILCFSTREKFVNEVFERLEGWWINRSISHFTLNENTPITKSELLSQLHDISEQYYEDNLPIYDFEFELPDEKAVEEDTRLFVEQLRLIMLRPKRIQKAISDYYIAYEQRSKWVRNDLLIDNELIKYESLLKDEWERKFESMLEELEEEEEREYQKKGRELYNLLQDVQLYIRKRCTEQTIVRGSYHILANQLDVGWHANFKERLRHLVKDTLEVKS